MEISDIILISILAAFTVISIKTIIKTNLISDSEKDYSCDIDH